VDEGGRRHQRWSLVDDHGHEHLAVSGARRLGLSPCLPPFS
jgi:hypothetical protein